MTGNGHQNRKHPSGMQCEQVGEHRSMTVASMHSVKIARVDVRVVPQKMLVRSVLMPTTCGMEMCS